MELVSDQEFKHLAEDHCPPIPIWRYFGSTLSLSNFANFLSSFLVVGNKRNTLAKMCAGPGVSETHPYKVIFHPLTGLCVLRKTLLGPLKLGPCTESEAWKYRPQNNLRLRGTCFCLQANDFGKQFAKTWCILPRL